MKEIYDKLRDDEHYYGDFGKQFLSNSDISTLLKNPKDLHKPKPSSPALLVGGYFHTAILEPDKLNRFKIVVDDFSITKFTPEALHRMVEAYYEMGMYEDSYNTAALLGYNYPESKWYKYSYNLVEQIDGEETFLKKIRNFFDG